ncbi:MAG TPA: amino acid adenylation domain-containing protein, partial [Longimicrobiaceae bacterium]|nr:amino acid adenylation domain-containing protein [Longimicrobiaceae bacterium]
VCAAYPVPRGGAVGRQMVGAPLPGARLYVVDRSGTPIPVGVPGELCIGGRGVSRGYLGRPELTAERFVPDPFGGEPGKRVYRTGDQVRWLADGNLEFLGRVDQQVKVRGFRIEPGEVEAVLRRHPHVGHAVVVVREDIPGDRRLTGYVVAANGTPPVPSDLRSYLGERLPDYMVPGAFVVLDRLPLTPTGKVDRRALPAPEGAVEGAYVAPRTPAEELLAGIWGELLAVGRVGVHDGFFDLGGHSLLATRVVSRVREAFGIELPLRALFEAPTVAGLAGRVEDALRAGGRLQSPPLVPVPRDRPLPLSFSQERLWFLDRLEPVNAYYNIATAVRLRGPLDAGLLERSLGEVVRRHESLRTVFGTVGEEAVQVVVPPAGFVLPVQDLAALPEDGREETMLRLVREEARGPFDLERGPLLRARLLRLAAGEHVLHLTLHHIVGDAWSFGVLWRELSRAYSAAAGGDTSPLPELPVQYGDYAAWQREWLRGEVLERQLAYWRGTLEGAPALLELPTDRLRPSVQTHRAGEHFFTLSSALSDALREASRREGATLFMTLLAGWQLLLARWSGQDDIVVGTPIAGRTRAETEGLIGFFVNMLALRTDLAGDPTFGELVRRVRETTLGAYAHQDVPFEKLLEELKVERSLSHSSVYQAMMVLHNAWSDTPDLLELEASPVRVGTASAVVDVELAMREGPEGITGSLVYNADLFDEATVASHVEHFHLLLEAAAADPARRISTLAPLVEAERRLQVVEWNRTERAFPRDRCAHGLFEAQAERTPDAPAFISGGKTLTYGELNRGADRLARRLRARGVGPESRVAICVERGPEMLVAVLGTLKAGAAYVPLDPGNPAERLAYALEDSGATVLLTQERLRDGLPEFAGQVLPLDEAGEDADAPTHPARERAGKPSPRNAAYVIYTSGSTGKPKGVVVEHRSLVNFAEAARAEYGIGAGDRVLQFASLSFDASAEEIFPALFGGAALVPRTEEMLRTIPAFLERCAEEGVTVLDLPTAFWHEVVVELEQGEGVVPPCVRLIIIGGERALPERVAAWRARVGSRVRLVNTYGPTETTVVATAVDLADSPARACAALPLSPVPIGRPVANARAYILDREMRPVPVGVRGELYVGGEGVARGYLGRPELTAERFAPNPFAGEPGARLYRTGDVARRRRDGELEFVGRADFQVKVRGFRVEPGEIEAALVRHPRVQEAVVVAREDEPGRTRLVAHVVPAPASPAAGPAPGAAELRTFLKGSVPEYMVPSAFVLLDRLPLTSSGKVDRRALPEPGEAGSGGAHLSPRTPTERAIAVIWSDVLRVERVGAHDDFFALGGHSLVATRVASRVREALGVELPLRALFEAPTVAGLAERVDALRVGVVDPGSGVIPRVPREGPLPLSPAQQRLWFLDQLEPGSAAYNLAFPIRLQGRVEVRVLQGALTEVVRRHETLRTVLRSVDGEGVQVILPPAPVPLPRIDLTALPGEVREEEARRLAREEGLRPFDLARGPLLRSTLLRLGGDDWALLFTMHHIVSDAWSMEVLVREVSELYAARVEGRAPALPELPVQYADYAAWQRGRLTGELLAAQIRYWREALADAPALLDLPTDRPAPATPGTRTAARSVGIGPETVARLRALGRGEGTTLFVVLLAGLQTLLARYSGQDDISVGTPVAGRNRVEAEPLIGFFVNTLVIRADLSGDPSLRDLVRSVRERVLEAHAHQEVPFEKLVEELQPRRDLRQTPFFRVAFTLQAANPALARLGPVRMAPLDEVHEAAKFDLTLGMVEDGDELSAALTYRTELWDAPSIDRMLLGFARVLDAMAADPAQRVSGVDLLGAAERARLLQGWNAAPAELPRVPVHRLFREQAARTPDAVAVVFREERLTYAELDRRSDRLARVLRSGGVGPEIRVGLYADRSAGMVVALLGILKAGGVFVPLDPTYPAERIAYLLEDSACGAVLVQDALRGGLPGAPVHLHSLDALLASTDDGAAPEPEVQPENAAYVIYTSGSTGRPKGVVVPHRALAGTLLAAREAFGFEPGDEMPSLASFAFDIWLFETLLPLLCGASVRIVPRERVVEVEALVEEVAGATLLHAVPALMRQVVERVAAGRGTLPSLRQVFVGGEAVLPELLGAMRSVFPAAEARILYGPTEGTIICAAHPVRGDESGGRHLLGGPLGNAPLYVLDGAGEPTPVGVPGELYIGGAGVARGYLGRADLTAEKFVPDPFGSGAGGRMYRTGDRARWGAAGTLEYLGRTDFQVKVRGFRIELGEVEAALLEHASVREVAVLAREDAPGERRLVGYVVPGAAGVSVQALRTHLTGRLPAYLVPGALVVLDVLPRTPTGKLDRRALPAPELSSGESYVAPRTPVEELLAGIWSDVLGIDCVGATDDFFALGGHSLLATRVVSRVRGAFGVELPLRSLFEAPTVAGLAERVEVARREGAVSQEPPILPVPRDRPLPLSFAQQRLWFIDELEPGTATYSIPTALRVRGRVDTGVLRRCLEEIVRRHESLRTVFDRVDGRMVQVILPPGDARLPEVDLRGLAEARRGVVARRLAAEEARRPFDLSRGPLLRTMVVRSGEEEFTLLLTMHHIVSDGWSMEVLVREVTSLYAAMQRGAPSPLPPLPVQYADYAAWQRAWLEGEVLDRQLSYWKERLAGTPPVVEIPTDRPRPRVVGSAGGGRPFHLPAGTTAALRTLARRDGATLFMVLMAGWQALLARWSGQDDVVVGTPIAGRNRVELEGLIGFFVNTLVIRASLAGRPDSRELLRRVREATLGAYQHQDLPFEKLVEELGVERSLSHTPLFQTVLSLQSADGPALRLGDAALEAAEAEDASAKFDLTFIVTDLGERLGGSLVYRAELWEASTIDRMLEHFALLLEGMASSPDHPVATLPMLPGWEREQVLLGWNDAAARDYPRGACVHELFAAQAARTPDATALVYRGELLTYAELDRASARMANHLRGRGVALETRVGICLERTPELVVALLAVLRAGGAYVPLDPAYPRERLAAMQEDAGVSLVLTSTCLSGVLPEGTP